MTTNKLESIDEALGRPNDDDDIQSTRPGRIDRRLYIGALDYRARLKLAPRILKDAPELVSQIVADGDGDTAAQFQERCSRVALLQLWAGRDAQDAIEPKVESSQATGTVLTPTSATTPVPWQSNRP